jgi:aerobic carbon-monoxide dehydrogenase medium subunit
MVTYARMTQDADVAASMPLLAHVSGGVTGGRQLTGQATFVGSVCNNIPNSEAPSVAVALGATVDIFGPAGRRQMTAADFLIGDGAVDLRPGEFVTSLSAPRHAAAGYCKIKNSVGSWPITTATAVLVTGTGRVRVVIGAASATPVSFELPSIDAGMDVLEATIGALLGEARTDVLAPAEYRRAVAPIAARRALDELERNLGA